MMQAANSFFRAVRTSNTMLLNDGPLINNNGLHSDRIFHSRNRQFILYTEFNTSNLRGKGNLAIKYWITTHIANALLISSWKQMLNVLVCTFCFWKLPFAEVLKINVLNEGYTKRKGWSKDVSVRAMKALGDVEVQLHSFILNFDTEWRPLASCMLWPHYPQEKILWSHLSRRVGGPQSHSGCFGKKMSLVTVSNHIITLQFASLHPSH